MIIYFNKIPNIARQGEENRGLSRVFVEGEKEKRRVGSERRWERKLPRGKKNGVIPVSGKFDIGRDARAIARKREEERQGKKKKRGERARWT